MPNIEFSPAVKERLIDVALHDVSHELPILVLHLLQTSLNAAESCQSYAVSPVCVLSWLYNPHPIWLSLVLSRESLELRCISCLQMICFGNILKRVLVALCEEMGQRAKQIFLRTYAVISGKVV
jgi:hypothetical protein